jgi:AcrR family transcriptional regulator
VNERPGQVRSVQTRKRLLDATVDCLVDHGYAGTTMQRVQARAGVSRGALVHHFPSMEDLLVGAIQHVARRQLDQLRLALASLSGDEDERDQTVHLLHSFMSGPLFLAGLELWLAARTNPSLRTALVPVERELGREIRAAVGSDSANKLTKTADLDELLVVLRGLAITSVLRPVPDLENRLIERWIARVS